MSLGMPTTLYRAKPHALLVTTTGTIGGILETEQIRARISAADIGGYGSRI